MSALSTRILVLGVVKIFGPANGYRLRQELLSWQVERWAALNPGSIYSMLSTLAKQGAISRWDLSAGADVRSATVYTVTEAGEAEFHRLIVEALATVPDSGDVLPLRVVVNFTWTLPRDEFLRAARARRQVLAELIPQYAGAISELKGTTSVPPSIAIELGLEWGLAQAQLAWVDELIALVADGGLYFLGEDDKVSWRPADDDSGWPMMLERQSYVERIAALKKSAPQG
jgi:DNA-binding PadR family transcriptional regulator